MEAERHRARQRGSVAGLAAWSYLATATGLVTGPILARALGPGGRGEVAAGLMISGLSTGVLSLGMTLAASYETAKRPSEDLPGLLGTGLRYTGAVVPFALVAAVAVPWFGLSDYDTSTRIVLGVLIALTPIDVFIGFLAGVFRGSGSLRPLSRIRVIPLVINLVVVVGLALVGELSVPAVLASGIAATVLTAVYAFVAVGVRPRGAVPLGPLVRFGMRGFVGSFGETVMLRADQVVIAFALPAAQLGLYAVATTVAQVPRGLATAVSSRAFGETASLEGGEAIERAEHYGRVASVLTLGSIVAVGLATPLIPFVFGEPFRGAMAPLLLLIPGAAALVWAGTMGGQLVSLGRPGLQSLARLPGFVVTLLALPFAIPLWGIRGAATVSSVAYVVQAVTVWILLRRLGLRHVRPGGKDVAMVLSQATGWRPRSRAAA